MPTHRILHIQTRVSPIHLTNIVRALQAHGTNFRGVRSMSALIASIVEEYARLLAAVHPMEDLDMHSAIQLLLEWGWIGERGKNDAVAKQALAVAQPPEFAVDIHTQRLLEKVMKGEAASLGDATEQPPATVRSQEAALRDSGILPQ
jgi:hypothetical protein